MRPAVRLVSFVVCVFVSVPAFAGFASTESFLPAVGRIAGQGGAQFYTTVWVTNLSNEATVHFTFQFLKQGQGNASGAPSFTDALAPGETKIYENVIEEKLGLAGAIGAGRIVADGEIFASERIYNQAHPADNLGTTEGLFFAAVPVSFSIGLGESASVQGVNQGSTENMRTNFALVETAGASATVHVALLSNLGATLGAADFPLQAYEQIQPNVAQLFSGVSTINARLQATVTAGSGKAIIAGAQLANTSQDSSGFEMSFKDSLLGGGAPAGVASLNGLTGAVTLAAGSNVTLSKSGQTVTIAASGSGGGGLALPYSGTVSLSEAAFLVQNKGSGPALRGINGNGPLLLTAAAGLQGDSDIGPGIIGTSQHSTGVQGVGIDSVGVVGISGGNDSTSAGVVGASTTGKGIGVFGTSDDYYGVSGKSQSSSGVYGISDTSDGVTGIAKSSVGGSGVAGINDAGGNGVGVYGRAEASSNKAGYFEGGISVYGHVVVNGVSVLAAPNPNDPTLEIQLAALHGPESGTYFRGSARIVEGLATIEVPEAFRLATSENGLTVQATPLGAPAVLFCVKKGLERIVIRGSADVDFDYLVNGVRKGSDGFMAVVPNVNFIPRSPDDAIFAHHRDAETIAALKANGILNGDGSINMETVRRLGWDKRPGWRSAGPPAGGAYRGVRECPGAGVAMAAFGAPRGQRVGDAAKAMPLRSSSRGNTADDPAPPEPGGRRRIANDLCVAPRARCTTASNPGARH